MDSVMAKRDGLDNRSHMGSEYMDAETYLAQRPRVGTVGPGKKKLKGEKQHGSNDSDFGMPDQKQD